MHKFDNMDQCLGANTSAQCRVVCQRERISMPHVRIVAAAPTAFRTFGADRTAHRRSWLSLRRWPPPARRSRRWHRHATWYTMAAMVDDDLALLDRWSSGDRAAGNALFSRHFEAVYRFFEHKT